jgi:hypothetical protein
MVGTSGKNARRENNKENNSLEAIIIQTLEDDLRKNGKMFYKTFKS